MLAVLWDVTDVSVLIVGGGPVGRRKAAAMQSAGAIVRVVDPRPPTENFPWSWTDEPYRADHLAGVRVAVAAATVAVNAQVVADATAAGIWVCSATDPTAGTFTFPAAVRRGKFTIAVGTGGAAPAFARRVRDRLAEQFDATHGEFVALLGDLRSLGRTSIPDPVVRRRVFDELSAFAWLDRLRLDGPTATRAAMEAVIRNAGTAG